MIGDARPAVGDSHLMLGDAFGNPVNLATIGILAITESESSLSEFRKALSNAYLSG